MNSANPRSYRPDDSLQHPSHEAGPDELPPVAHDAPPLRADQYDPVWVSETEEQHREAMEQRREAMTQQDLDRLEKIITSEHFRVRQRRFPNFAPPPPPPAVHRRGGLRWTVGTFAALVVSSSVVALYSTGRLPIPDEWSERVSEQGTRIASLLATESPPAATESKPTAPAAQQAMPRLVVKGANAENNEEILLGVAVESPREGLTAVVSGLAEGTTLSAGKPWGSTGWLLPASELGKTFLRPPVGFTGVMEYTVALQLADGAAVDRQSMRLEWAAPAAQPPAAATPPEPAQPPVARKLDAQEIALMVKRGEELLANGDIASARLLLRRAAEGGDARAAFALATSYDPIALRKLGVYGSAPDVKVARDWYEKARQYGSREAPQRLELLASQYR
jgi:hypothetical protein